MAAAAAYAGIFAAAAVEGEIVFISAAVLVAGGKLNAMGVGLAGALGAAAGDQFFFYLLRGRVSGWLARIRPVGARRESIVGRVRRHQTLMVLVIRFAPGLRIAITAACAYAGVPAIRFTLLNLFSALMWAAVILTLVSRAGPGILQHAGITGVWGAVVPAALLVAFFWWLGRDLSAENQAETQARGSRDRVSATDDDPRPDK
jgi:membrane protein DedA with SNARE-associated domain